MALSKLVKGQAVMALSVRNDSSKYTVGTLGTVRRGEANFKGEYDMNFDGPAGHIMCLPRNKLLAIGDKVVRGPDWNSGGYQDSSAGEEGGIGTVTGFNHPGADEEHNVTVDWSTRKDNCHRMTADHQDLKPTGDSVDTGDSEDDKPDCYGKYPCKDNTCYNGDNPNCPSNPGVGESCKCATCMVNSKCKSGTKTKDKPECWGTRGHCTQQRPRQDCSECEHFNSRGCDCHSCKVDNMECRRVSGKAGYILKPINKDKHYDKESPAKTIEPKHEGDAHWKQDTNYYRQMQVYTECMKPFKFDKSFIKQLREGDTTMSETFDRLQRAKEIEMTELPKAKNATKAAGEKEVLLAEEMDRLTTFPTEYAEKEFLLQKLTGKDRAKEVMRCIELGLPVTVNIEEEK